MEETVKIGYTTYQLMAEFVSLEGKKLYVGVAITGRLALQGLYRHVILAKDKNNKWFLHI